MTYSLEDKNFIYKELQEIVTAKSAKEKLVNISGERVGIPI
jgi:hypothetical protein